MIFFSIIVILSFLCWVSSLFFLTKRNGGYLRHMIWFLALTLVTEFAGYLVYFQFRQPNNYWVFNLFMGVELLFLSWLMHQISAPYYNSKPWIVAGLTLLLLTYFYESSQSGFLELSMKTKNMFAVYMILLALSYYYFLLKSETYFQLKDHPPFWIVTGVFFFYFGSVMADLFFDYLLSINKVAIRPVRFSIFIVLNLILYGSWSYSFLCKYRQTTSSSW
ncbi:MAG TPA: hypothetical protein VGD65_06180 [Chryseosolibacter sp.]